MVMIQYEKEDNYPEKCYPVNCDFEKVNLNKKILVNENPFEPDFQTKLENQANLLPSTENHVIENFYTDYKCPPPSKLSTLKKWRTSLGQKTGNALAKTLQIVPSITNKFHNSISAGWHGIKHSVAKKSYHLFQGSKTIIKASAKPLAITVGIIAVVGVGYLVIEFFNNTILPSIQDATPRNLRKNVAAH